MSTGSRVGLDALLTPEESVDLLIDHQPFRFANLHSHEPTRSRCSTVAPPVWPSPGRRSSSPDTPEAASDLTAAPVGPSCR